MNDQSVLPPSDRIAQIRQDEEEKDTRVEPSVPCVEGQDLPQRGNEE